MAFSNRVSWETDLRKSIRSNYGQGWTVIGENSGRTKLTYQYPNEARKASNTLSLEWKKTNGLQILKAIEFINPLVRVENLTLKEAARRWKAQFVGDDIKAPNKAWKDFLIIPPKFSYDKKEYQKARQLYQESIDIFNNYGSQNVGTALWRTNTYIYEKKYDKAIKAIDKVEEMLISSTGEMGEMQKNNQLYRCDFERYLAYGHSQMKNDAYESLQNMNGHLDTYKRLRKKIASSDTETERIDLEVEISKEFNNIWYLILFGEFEDAAEQLKSYSQLSSSYLVYDSKAMINFYKLSGYLNLMSGNVDASLSFYNQIPRELLDGDNYHLYFYALAVNAKGDREKSKELFQYLANYNFAGWENSVIRSLAEAQLEG